MERKAGILWIKMPCLLNVGSCVYNDLCTLLPKIGVKLPPTLKCPFQKVGKRLNEI